MNSLSISSRFAVGIHILSLLEINKGGVSSSEYIANSVNTNPVVIRKIMGMLKNAGLVNVRPGIAGAELARTYRKLHCLMSIRLLTLFRKKNYLAYMTVRIQLVLWEEIFKIRLAPSFLRHSLQWKSHWGM